MPRIAIVSDIHHGPNHGLKRGEAAAEMMAGFVRFCDAHKPDLVLDLTL